MTNTVLRLVLILVSTATVAIAADAPASIEDRVRALETQLAKISQENGDLKKQLGISPKAAPTFVTTQGKETKLSLGGFIQGQAEFGDASDSRTVAGDRFYLRRARIGVKGSFAEHFDFTLQTDLGSNSLGSVTGNRAQATDAFVVWSQYDQANVTFGQFKTPYGYEQLMSDTKIATIERSLPSDSLTLSRQLGAMVSGSVLDKKLSYAAGLFNGNGVNTSTNDNDNFMYVGRLNGTAYASKTVKVTAGAGAFASRDTGTFTGCRTGAQFDTQVVFGRGEIDAEYFQTHFNRVTGTDTDARGWAILGAWFIVPGKVQAVGRYETYDPNTDVANDDARLWTIGVNYLLKGDDIKFGVNYLIGDPAGPLKNQGRLLTRVQLVF
jgi:phosphate-selective porin OprO/OprP